jgi:hypothetical protein
MADATQEREETLGEFLASRARRASDGQLAWQAITAVLAAIAIAFWRGPGWDMRFAIATCALAFCIWGVADRELAQSRLRRAGFLLRITRLTVAVLGFAAAAYLMMAALGRALGRLIS